LQIQNQSRKDSKKFFKEFSIVTEWENYVNTESWRPRKMLHKLFQQIEEISNNLSSKPEFLIVYNPDDVKKNEIEKIVNEGIKNYTNLVDLKFIPAFGCGYYQLKNFGSKQCTKDIVIFIDSDVVPDDGWLTSILESFNKPNIHVVTGNTYMPLTNLVEKAIALIWYFPPETDKSETFEETDFFFANNVAFSREIFKKYNFPDLEGLRGQNVAVANKLIFNGIKIYRQHKARVSHPASNGFVHFIHRGLQLGYDKGCSIIREQELDSSTLDREGRSAGKTSMRKIISKIRYRYKFLNLNPFEVLPVFTIATTYLALGAVGLLITLIWPGSLKKRLSV